MLTQIKVNLPQNEFSALVKLAIEELRDPPSQVHLIVRQELIRRGLLGEILPKEQPLENRPLESAITE